MKKFLTTTAASAIAAVAFGSAAKADVFLYWNVAKDQDIHVLVDTQKDWLVDVYVRLDARLRGSAQAQALTNALIEADTSDDRSYRRYSSGVDAHASTVDSLNYNVGIGQANQDVGNFSNQGNTAAAAINLGGDDYVNAEAYAEQITRWNWLESDEYYNELVNLSASLIGSLNDNTGIFHFNQNSGDGNNQHNLLALAVGGDAVVALAESGLSQLTTVNYTTEYNTARASEIVGSVNHNQGLVNVNQSSGFANNQSTVYSLAVRSSSVGIGGN